MRWRNRTELRSSGPFDRSRQSRLQGRRATAKSCESRGTRCLDSPHEAHPDAGWVGRRVERCRRDDPRFESTLEFKPFLFRTRGGRGRGRLRRRVLPRAPRRLVYRSRRTRFAGSVFAFVRCGVGVPAGGPLDGRGLPGVASSVGSRGWFCRAGGVPGRRPGRARSGPLQPPPATGSSSCPGGGNRVSPPRRPETRRLPDVGQRVGRLRPVSRFARGAPGGKGVPGVEAARRTRVPRRGRPHP